MVDPYDPLAVMLEAQAGRVRRAQHHEEDDDNWCKEMEQAHKLAAGYVTAAGEIKDEVGPEDPTAALSELRSIFFRASKDTQDGILAELRRIVGARE
jgi:hypothetical protein